MHLFLYLLASSSSCNQTSLSSLLNSPGGQKVHTLHNKMQSHSCKHSQLQGGRFLIAVWQDSQKMQLRVHNDLEHPSHIGWKWKTRNGSFPHYSIASWVFFQKQPIKGFYRHLVGWTWHWQPPKRLAASKTSVLWNALVSTELTYSIHLDDSMFP